MNTTTFVRIDACNLVLWKVNVPARNLDQVSTTDATKLDDGACPLSEYAWARDILLYLGRQLPMYDSGFMNEGQSRGS